MMVFHVKRRPWSMPTRTLPSLHRLWMTTAQNCPLTRGFIHRGLWMKLGADPHQPPLTSSSGRVPHLLEWAL